MPPRLVGCNCAHQVFIEAPFARAPLEYLVGRACEVAVYAGEAAGRSASAISMDRGEIAARGHRVVGRVILGTRFEVGITRHGRRARRTARQGRTGRQRGEIRRGRYAGILHVYHRRRGAHRTTRAVEGHGRNCMVTVGDGSGIPIQTERRAGAEIVAVDIKVDPRHT
jgi:hypothetical protein